MCIRMSGILKRESAPSRMMHDGTKRKGLWDGVSRVQLFVGWMVFLRSHGNWDGLLETHCFIGEGVGVQVYPLADWDGVLELPPLCRLVKGS